MEESAEESEEGGEKGQGREREVCVCACERDRERERVVSEGSERYNFVYFPFSRRAYEPDC